MEPGGLQKEKGPKAQDRKRRAGRDDVVRSCLPSSLALYWKLESKLVQRFKQQVRAADQAAYPEVTIESFVGHSSMGLLCPPAQNNSKRIPVTTKGTLMDMRTDLIAAPHAGLGFHFLRVSVGNQRILGVFKRRNGPKRKKTNDGRTG